MCIRDRPVTDQTHGVVYKRYQDCEDIIYTNDPGKGSETPVHDIEYQADGTKITATCQINEEHTADVSIQLSLIHIYRVILKELKTVKEQIDSCPADRTDLLEEYKYRYDVINEYAPQLLSAEEVEQILKEKFSEVLASGNKGPVSYTHLKSVSMILEQLRIT